MINMYIGIPRKYNTDKMMTRYFIHEFMYVEDFLGINSAEALIGEDTLDGKVITLYSFTGIKQEVVKRHLLNLADKHAQLLSAMLTLEDIPMLP